jgi:hypothetical protein
MILYENKMSVKVYPHLLTTEEVQYLLTFFPEQYDKYSNGDKYHLLGPHPLLEKYLVERVLSKIAVVDEHKVSYQSSGTVSMNSSVRPVAIHFDSKFNERETNNLLVYLTTGGSTEFFDRCLTSLQTVQSAAGTVVVFDIELMRRGGPLPLNNIKKTVGLRLMKEA